MNKKPTIVLINPGSTQTVYQRLNNRLSAIESPSLAALFATYFRNHGCEVRLIDASAENLSPMMVVEKIEQDSQFPTLFPTLIVLVIYSFQPSASTQNMPASGEIASVIRKTSLDYKILMTGTHPAALPPRTMQEEEVDFVCDREGSQTILQTALELTKKSPQFAKIKSLRYREGQRIIGNEPEELLINLESTMAHGSWDLLPMDRYRAHNWHCFEHIDEQQPYVSLYTSLGCPYKCSFCCINALFSKSSYRVWSPETVLKNIDRLVKNYGIRNIKFADEMFVLNRNHVLDICDLIIQRDYDLNIWVYTRVDTIKDEFLDKLKRAGFRWLTLDIESGSKYVRNKIKQGRLESKEILQVVKKIQDAGINVIGNYIFGLPGDDHKSMRETLNLAIEANCEFANFYSTMAYPGSKLYTITTTDRWQSPNSWIGYSQHSYECTPLSTEYLTAAEVLTFCDQVFKTYFSNSRYLNLIKAKFGQKVINHVKDMLSITLSRKLLIGQVVAI
ncbi:B12-binding domain-containing radical SAM protein [Coxiella endosymbiont of Amblyomma nuttalli]|uniref:B12-binding domain-containing radical SAM protein n=1 Tax=Coxiella endosymbiont of Amblyomma nuttalli TaxID=2749996 RepID=UPI001BA5FFF5|nr:radical SAM protein [Coxiella endosymbiont of Amblyomma nuttalli]QTS84147.1 B12-binding domain-containing radical SAM protein [Coxiella endosymbiont of Amblyomma nuttalli]